MFRGYKIRVDPRTNEFIFVDTGEPTITTWKDRPCGHCGLPNTDEGHDGCIGTLPNVINACCGHGEVGSAYLQFEDGSELRGQEALLWVSNYKHTKESSK